MDFVSIRRRDYEYYSFGAAGGMVPHCGNNGLKLTHAQFDK